MTFGNSHFIFICGLHRSGTSLLHRAIACHPEISGFKNTGVTEDEGQHLQTVYPIGTFYGGPGKFAFDKNAHFTESSPLCTEENAEKLFKQWSPHWDLSKKYFVEKSPPNLLKTRFLQRLFGRCSFIVIMRNPVSVSLASQKMSNAPFPQLIRHWLHAHTLFEEDRPFLNSVQIIRYETLLEDFDNTMAGIFQQLGLSPFKPVSEVLSDKDERYHKRWDQLKKESSNVKRLATLFQEQLQPFGYSL